VSGDGPERDGEARHHNRERLYGRRKGRKLRDAQAERIARLLPQLAIPAPALDVLLDPGTLFAMPVRAIWLEIGFGSGEHLAAQAAAHPDIGFIGCEVFETGIATLLRSVEAERLDNLRLWPDDARRLLAHLPPASIDRAFLLFPDPWPKQRHSNRRFVAPGNLDRLADLLADGAELRIASDDPGYAVWTLMHVCRHPAFAWTARRPADWQSRPDGWPETRYEAKAIAAGRKPVFFRFIRCNRPD
jgi:tRNA (guanine-N7-)-methyltransferase